MADAPRAAGSARAWYVAALLSLLYVVSFADRLVIGILVGPIRRDLGASDAQIGLLMGFSFSVLYSILGLVLAQIADRGDRRRLILVGVTIWSLMTLASAFAPTFLTLAACRMGVGIGEAALGPAALSMIAGLFPAERRHAPVSMFSAAGLLGGTGAFMVGAAALGLAESGRLSGIGFLNGMASWRIVFLIMGLPGLILAAVMALTVGEPARGGQVGPAPSLRAVFSHMAADRHWYAPLFLGLGTMQLVAYAIAAWYPTLLVRSYGITPAKAGYLFGGLGAVAGVAGALIAPAIVGMLQRRGRQDALHAVGWSFLLLATPCLIAAVLWPTLIGSVAWMTPGIFFLIGAGGLPSLTAQLIAPERLRARVTSIYFLGVNLIGLGLGVSSQ